MSGSFVSIRALYNSCPFGSREKQWRVFGFCDHNKFVHNSFILNGRPAEMTVPWDRNLIKKFETTCPDFKICGKRMFAPIVTTSITTTTEKILQSESFRKSF